MKKSLIVIGIMLLLPTTVWSGIEDITIVETNFDAGQKVTGTNQYERAYNLSNAPSEIRDAAGTIFNGRTVYYFNGFDFKNYKMTDPNLNTITASEVRAITQGIPGQTQITRANGHYSIIGHSQGGLRALAYISELKRSYPDNQGVLDNIDAVITISGINQGLPALDDGLAGVRGRIAPKINTIGNGLRAAVGIYDVLGGFVPFIPRDKLSSAIDFFISIIPRSKRPYWAEAWKFPFTHLYPQIAGMVPGSNYIRENVVENVQYTYKKQMNPSLYMYIAVPVSRPKFDESVPVGFIVGLDNITLNMADNPSGVRKGVRAAEVGFGVVEAVHINRCVGLIGLITGSVTYAYDASRARKFMDNIDSEMYHVIGSTEGDGLVALNSQYIPLKSGSSVVGEVQTLNNLVLGKPENDEVWEGFVRKPYYNHQNISQMADVYVTANDMISESRLLRGRDN